MNKLLKALRPFISENMQKISTEMSDDVPVSLEICSRNGHLLSLNLGQLRALWTAYQEEKYLHPDRQDFEHIPEKTSKFKDLLEKPQMR